MFFIVMLKHFGCVLLGHLNFLDVFVWVMSELRQSYNRVSNPGTELVIRTFCPSMVFCLCRFGCVFVVQDPSSHIFSQPSQGLLGDYSMCCWSGFGRSVCFEFVFLQSQTVCSCWKSMRVQTYAYFCIEMSLWILYISFNNIFVFVVPASTICLFLLFQLQLYVCFCCSSFNYILVFVFPALTLLCFCYKEQQFRMISDFLFWS